MRKKLVVTLLAASMMGSMLAGCGGGTSGEEGKESSKKGDTIKVMCVPLPFLEMQHYTTLKATCLPLTMERHLPLSTKLLI